MTLKPLSTRDGLEVMEPFSERPAGCHERVTTKETCVELFGTIPSGKLI